MFGKEKVVFNEGVCCGGADVETVAVGKVAMMMMMMAVKVAMGVIVVGVKEDVEKPRRRSSDETEVQDQDEMRTRSVLDDDRQRRLVCALSNLRHCLRYCRGKVKGCKFGHV